MAKTLPGSARQLHKYIANRLTGVYDHREAENIARIVITDLLAIHPNLLVVNEAIALSENQKSTLESALQRLLGHEPVQHILGRAWFYGREFMVNRHVLIPRPETEELVNWIVDQKMTNPKILDIGTGSGCIALSLALEIPGAHTDAIEVSPDALDMAQANAAALGAHVNFIETDILKLQTLPGEYDVIVSNPPYIPDSDQRKMSKQVIDFEPHLALFVDDYHPLLFYEKIGQLALVHLTETGKLFFELHEDRAEEVRDRLLQMGFGNVIVKRDMQGKNRMISASLT